MYRTSYSCIGICNQLLQDMNNHLAVKLISITKEMYYTESYQRNLSIRLNELHEKKVEREALLKKKKTYAQLQRMIHKKLELEQKLNLLKDIEERRIQIINLNRHQYLAKGEEIWKLHTANMETIEMMKRSRSKSIKDKKVSKSLQRTLKASQLPSNEKVFQSTNGSIKDEIIQVSHLQKNLEVKIEKKARLWRNQECGFSRDHERDNKMIETFSLGKRRPVSAHFQRSRKLKSRQLNLEEFQNEKANKSLTVQAQEANHNKV